MAGINYKVSPKVLFDFSQVAASQYQEIVVAKAIPVFQYREATLLVRFHTGGTTPTSGQSVDIRVRSEDPSSDDPAVDFVNVTDLAVATVDHSTAAAPLLLVVPISYSSNQNFGSFLRVVARGTQPGTTATLQIYLSIDIALKSS